jgi:hypothetical protein
MSSALVKAHGGAKNMLGSKGQVNTSLFVTDTKVGKMKSASASHLGLLISNTTGMPAGKPVMEGVITDTKSGMKDKNVPELHKVSGRGKTQPKRQGQVPYAGSKY